MNMNIENLGILTSALTAHLVAINEILSKKDVLPTDIIEERQLLEDDAAHSIESLNFRARALQRRVEKRLKPSTK